MTTTASVATTTPSTAATVIPAPTRITDPQAVIDAAMASNAERATLSYFEPEKRSASGFTSSTPSFVAALLKHFAENDSNHKRFAPGSIDKQVPIRIEETAGNVTVVLCFTNNAKEFDSKGTASIDDDTLIQEDLVVYALRVDMVLQGGRWLANGHKVRESTECAAIYS